MTTLETKRMTLEEFCALPDGPPNYEFEAGEAIPVPSPTIDHQDIIVELSSLLKRFVRRHRLGRIFMEVDVYLPDGRVLIPDISFLAKNRLAMIDPVDRKVHGAPDLMIEVTSEDTARDRIHKFQVYYNNGVPWYWIIDSHTLAIEEYHATPQGYVRVSSAAIDDLFRPALFPGLEFNLKTLVSEADGEEEAEETPQDGDAEP